MSAASRLRLPRWVLAVGDQGVVAVTNLALSVLVTHVGGVTTLGRFAIETTTILLALGVVRLLICDPWLASRSAPRSVDGQLRWLVILGAVGSFIVVLVASLVIRDGHDAWLLAAPVAALFVVQDFGRYACFRVEASHRAFLSDSTVFVVGALTFVVSSLVTGHSTLAEVFLAWGVGLAAGLAVVSRPALGAVTVGGSLAWWRTHCRSLALKLGLDTAAYLAAVNGSIYLLAVLATQKDVGLVRVVQTVFSPAALLTTGMTMWLVPVLAGRSSEAAAVLRRRVTTWLTAASVPLLVAAVAVGPWFIGLVFGISDRPSHTVLALGGLSPLLLAIAAPWIASARVSGHYLPIAWSRAGAAVVTLVGMLAVPSLRGTAGYLALLALQSLMVTIAGFASVRRTEGATPRSHVAREPVPER